MAEEAQVSTTNRPLEAVLKEIDAAVRSARAAGPGADNVKDLRWQFDQISAKMNQAIYNDQKDQIHDSTLQTVVLLIELLSRV
jgi:hypothetical protein